MSSQVPLLGKEPPLHFSSRDAGRMWENSVPMPPEAVADDYSEERLRRSEDGFWAIRMQLHGDKGAAAVGEAARHEYTRLADMGLDIMNFASVPSVSSWRLFTITPWIEGLNTCDVEQFARYAAPILARYEAAPAEGGFPKLNVIELGDPRQLSWVDDPDSPFLHDVDPSLMPTLDVQNTNILSLAMAEAGFGRLAGLEFEGEQPAEQA